MSKVKAPIELSIEQIKEIEKLLRSSQEDIVTSGVKQITKDFFKSPTGLSTLMNNMNEKKVIKLNEDSQ